MRARRRRNIRSNIHERRARCWFAARADAPSVRGQRPRKIEARRFDSSAALQEKRLIPRLLNGMIIAFARRFFHNA
jgi:hypothetical protein